MDFITQFFHQGFSYTIVSLIFIGVSIWGLLFFKSILAELKKINKGLKIISNQIEKENHESQSKGSD